MAGPHPGDLASAASNVPTGDDPWGARLSPPTRVWQTGLPRNLGWLWAAGPCAGLLLLALALTGLALAAHYVPSEAGALASLESIDRHVGSGWLLRSIHAAGTSLLFVCLYVQLFTALYYGSFKAPRVAAWMSFLVLLLLCLAIASIGAMLPWNQPGYWSLIGLTDALGALPGFGRSLAMWLLGGPQAGPDTVTRLAALHAAAGAGVLAVLALHVASLRRTGPNNPLGLEVRGPRDLLPLHPFYTLRFGLVACLACLVLAIVVFFFPASLFGPASWQPASPLAPPAGLLPPWYAAPFHAVLRSVPSRGAGASLALAMGVVLFLAPWLDTSPVRSARFRPLYRIGMALLVVSALVLLVAGLNPGSGVWRLLARIAVLYWFAHFLLLLPWLGRAEKARPLPSGISRAVLPPRPEPSRAPGFGSDVGSPAE